MKGRKLMKMKPSRLIAIILCSALLIAFAAGCGGGGGGGSSNVTLEFWMQNYGDDPLGQQALMDGITERFKEETGITVNVTYIDWGQALARYTLASSGGEAPDAADTFFANSWRLIGGDDYGPMMIDDLAEELNAEGKMYSVAIAETKFDGHWYALPWRGDTRAAAYNQAHFDEAGITEFPKTYDELLEVAELLTIRNGNEIERSGFLFSVGGSRFDQQWFGILAGHGGAIMNANYTEFTFNSPQGIASIQFMQDAVHKYNIIPDYVIDPTFSSEELYYAEKASILLGAGPGFLRNVTINAPHLADVTKSAVMPSLTGTGISSIAFAAPVVVFKTTEHPDEAKEWVKFFVSTEVQLEMMKELSLVNSWIEVMEDDYFYNDPWFRNFTTQTGLANPGDMPTPEWSEVGSFPSGPLNVMLTEIMAGDDVQTAVDKAMRGVEDIYAAVGG